MNWEEAMRFCSKHRAEMVVIESRAEEKEIAHLLKNFLKIRWRFWMGVKKNYGVWRTKKGKKVTYAPWGPVEGFSSGDCVRVGGDLKWYQAPCGDSKLNWGNYNFPYTFNPFCKRPIAPHGKKK